MTKTYNAKDHNAAWDAAWDAAKDAARDAAWAAARGAQLAKFIEIFG